MGILPRKNELIRPAVANVDQALVVFAAARPDPHLNLLDRFLVMMERKGIPGHPVLQQDGYRGRPADPGAGADLQGLRMPDPVHQREEAGKHPAASRAAAGEDDHGGRPPPAWGSHRSSISCRGDVCMETGAISEKIGRGRHTTRHAELIAIDEESYIMDTPGFSSLYTNDFEKEELKQYFPEFHPFEGLCRYSGCDHVHEPGCAVKEAVEEGKIHRTRYENYLEMYEELKNKRRY